MTTHDALNDKWITYQFHNGEMWRIAARTVATEYANSMADSEAGDEPMSTWTDAWRRNYDAGASRPGLMGDWPDED